MSGVLGRSRRSWRRRRRYRKYGHTWQPSFRVVVAAAGALGTCLVAIAFVGANSVVRAHAAAAASVAVVNLNVVNLKVVDRNCTLIVPANPDTPLGLATPYQLTATDPADGPCHESDPEQAAFVQGAVINTDTGQISIYDPLVIDAGTTPAVTPPVPKLPQDSVVAVWFGFNGATLSLAGQDIGGANAGGTAGHPLLTGPWRGSLGDFPAASMAPDIVLQYGGCVAGESINGLFSPFGQAGACNAAAFFQAASAAIKAGKLTVPNPGRAADGQQCLTTRDFGLVDQDQSSGVTTEYLARANGQTAQDTAASRRQLAGAASAVLANDGDNALLTSFLDPAMGCRPWEVPDLASPGSATTGLPLDELQAAAFAGQSDGPAALVPPNDPMALDSNGSQNADKDNTYRTLVDMPALPAGQPPAEYCADMESIQGARLQQDVNLLARHPGPFPAVAGNLFLFMALRLQQSFVNLGCQRFGLRDDVSTTENGGGVVVAACFLRQVQAATPGAGNPTAGTAVCPANGPGPRLRHSGYNYWW